MRKLALLLVLLPLVGCTTGGDGSSARLIAADGMLEWFNVSSAVYANGKTFFCYQAHDGPNDEVWITAFDHTSEKLAKPFKLHGYTTAAGDGKMGHDDHGSPTIAVNSAGHLVVAYGQHISKGYFRVSTNAYDHSAWGAETVFESKGVSYPKLRVLANGEMWLFYRYSAGVNDLHAEVYRISTDDGFSWGARTTLITPTGPGSQGAVYAFVDNIGDEIHVAWTYYDYAESRFRDVYHAYTTNKIEWKNSAGGSISLPLTRKNCTPVHTSASGEDSWAFDIKLAAPGDLRIVYYDDLYGRTGSPALSYARQISGSWSKTKITTGTVFYNGYDPGGVPQLYPAGASIDSVDPNRLVVCGGASGLKDGTESTAEAQLWVTDDYNTWAKRATLSRQTPGSFDIRPQFVRDGIGPARVLWVEVESYTSMYEWSSSLIAASLAGGTKAEHAG